MRIPIGVVGGAIATVVACGGADGALVEPHLEEPSFLVSPADGGRFEQNDSTLGCPANATRGYGFRLSFDWRAVEGADRYHISFWQQDAQYPAVWREVTGTEYIETMCNAFVIDRNLENWRWQVIALGPDDSLDVASGDTLTWSEARMFRFAPCRLADGRPCYAPPSDTSATDTTPGMPQRVGH